jgi:hypothetical protein
MAGGIADGEEDWLILLPGFMKSLFVPGIPGYGIVGMLQKVGTFFVDKVIIRPAAFLIGMRHEALLLPVCFTWTMEVLSSKGKASFQGEQISRRCL